MEKKFAKEGDNYFLICDDIILELLKINPESDLVKYDVENGKLVITKANKLKP